MNTQNLGSFIHDSKWRWEPWSKLASQTSDSGKSLGSTEKACLGKKKKNGGRYTRATKYVHAHTHMSKHVHSQRHMLTNK